MRIALFRTLITAAFVATTSSAAFGQNIIARTTGLAGPARTITFSEFALAQDASVTNQFAGVAFSNGLYFNPQPGFFTSDPSVGNFNFSDDLTAQSLFSLTFSVTQGAGAALQLVANGGVTTFTAFLNGLQVGQFQSAVTSAPAYYGFENLSLDRIDVSIGSDGYGLLDNVQLSNTSTVPEPSTYMLMGIGLLALGAAARRTRPAA